MTPLYHRWIGNATPSVEKFGASTRFSDMASSAYEIRFARHMEALRQFAAREGHCEVPYSHIERVGDDDVALGRWAAYIRMRRRAGKVSASRLAQFSMVPGWSWEPRRPGPPPQSDRNKMMRKLRAEGVSLSVIAERFGLSKQRVYQLTAGVKPAKGSNQE